MQARLEFMFNSLPHYSENYVKREAMARSTKFMRKQTLSMTVDYLGNICEHCENAPDPEYNVPKSGPTNPQILADIIGIDVNYRS
jgi:hypothetical protein